VKKCIETTIGVKGKLSNERREQVGAVLLVGVPKIEIKISHRGQSIVAQGNDVLNDGGASPEVSNSKLMLLIVVTNQSMLFPDPAIRGQRLSN
jgi:hypothetical protein